MNVTEMFMCLRIIVITALMESPWEIDNKIVPLEKYDWEAIQRIGVREQVTYQNLCTLFIA